jgi:hypothetical protein
MGISPPYQVVDVGASPSASYCPRLLRPLSLQDPLLRFQPFSGMAQTPATIVTPGGDDTKTFRIISLLSSRLEPVSVQDRSAPDNVTLRLVVLIW